MTIPRRTNQPVQPGAAAKTLQPRDAQLFPTPGDGQHAPPRQTPMSADPVLIAYTARRVGTRKRKVWTRIGQAFPHETGAGLTLFLDMIPLDGVVILLERYEDDDDWLSRKVAPKAKSAPGKKLPPARPHKSPC